MCRTTGSLCDKSNQLGLNSVLPSHTFLRYPVCCCHRWEVDMTPGHKLDHWDIRKFVYMPHIDSGYRSDLPYNRWWCNSSLRYRHCYNISVNSRTLYRSSIRCIDWICRSDPGNNPDETHSFLFCKDLHHRPVRWRNLIFVGTNHTDS